MLKRLALSLPAISRLYRHRNELLSKNASFIRKRTVTPECQDWPKKTQSFWLNGKWAGPTEKVLEKEIRAGRNVSEGYFRGQGLEFGSLKGYVLECSAFSRSTRIDPGQDPLHLGKNCEPLFIDKIFSP